MIRAELNGEKTVRRSVVAIITGLTALALLLAGGVPSSAEPDSSATVTYQNPVSTPEAENFGSPTVIRGRDGFWYAFGPGNPLNPGEPAPRFPIMRSPDLVTWTSIGDVFTEETMPAWKGNDDCCLWAPAIEYADGEYRLYFTLRDIEGYPRPNYAIGVATAPTPAGPWTDSGAPLVEPRLWTPGGDTEARYRTIIDAEVITAGDGSRYLYYGGFGGGIYATRLARDGLSTLGAEHRLATDSTYEGPYVVRRDGWYYLFLSSGHCCRGPVSGYAVWAGRSRDPLGPFVDREGVRLDARSPGGTPVLTANGNRWAGVGHNAVISDLGGQDWTTFNGIDRDDPWSDAEGAGTRRPMLIDRLDWVDGWPVVEAGSGATEQPTTAPDSTGLIADAFEDGPGGENGSQRGWSRAPGWRIEQEAAGGFLSSSGRGGTSWASSRAAGDLRLRAVVRMDGGRAGGLRVRSVGGDREVAITVDRQQHALTAEYRTDGGVRWRRSAPLPDGVRLDQWHQLAVERSGRSLRVDLTDAGLYDPVARIEGRIPGRLGAVRIGATVAGGSADFDDLSVARLDREPDQTMPVPEAGAMLSADEFDRQPTGSWIGDPAAAVAEGKLRFPVQAADLGGTGNDASLLGYPAPDGDWIAETKVSLDFGTDSYQDFPQAGLLAYVDDDQYLRLTTRANRDVEIASYQKEITLSDQTPYGNAATVGPVADDTWLRLAQHTDPVTGEREIRAGTSRDGDRWTWGTVHTLPADADVRLALGAHGAGTDHGLVADFDYLRVYRNRTPEAAAGRQHG